MRNIALWVVQLLMGALFLLVGALKLSGAPALVAEFETIGFGQWLRYLTGFLEVTAAGLLWTPRYSVLGGLLLTLVMAGAVFIHLFILGGSPAPAAVLGLLAMLIAHARSEQFDLLWLEMAEFDESPA